MPGGRTQNGAAHKALAIGRATHTRQPTQVDGFQPKATDISLWMITMVWQVSKQETFGSWITCWSQKSDRHGLSDWRIV